MAEEPIRVGLIGAGGNVRNRHIPGFQGVEDCELVAVANRSIESGRAIADQYNIPRVYGNWRELLEDEDINAVCIGTWPYTHRTMTLAALESGKHVLTEARMASTAEEARDMLRASLDHPELVCQLTPTSTSYTIDNVLKRLIDEGHLGELLSVDFTSLQNNFADINGPLHWRHDRALSGHNTLNIGASYESHDALAGTRQPGFFHVQNQRPLPPRRERQPYLGYHPRPCGHSLRTGQRRPGAYADERHVRPERWQPHLDVWYGRHGPR